MYSQKHTNTCSIACDATMQPAGLLRHLFRLEYLISRNAQEKHGSYTLEIHIHSSKLCFLRADSDATFTDLHGLDDARRKAIRIPFTKSRCRWKQDRATQKQTQHTITIYCAVRVLSLLWGGTKKICVRTNAVDWSGVKTAISLALLSFLPASPLWGIALGLKRDDSLSYFFFCLILNRKELDLVWLSSFFFLKLFWQKFFGINLILCIYVRLWRQPGAFGRTNTR